MIDIHKGPVIKHLLGWAGGNMVGHEINCNKLGGLSNTVCSFGWAMKQI